MFDCFKNRTQKREALKIQTLAEFNKLLDKCTFGTFEHSVFTKAIKQLNNNQDPKTIRKWVGKLEKDWNKF